MFSRELSKPTEYEIVMENCKERVRTNYLYGRAVQKLNMGSFPHGKWPIEQDIFVTTPASTDLLSTESAIYKIVPKKNNIDDFNYEPIIFAASYTLRKVDKIEISFAGYIQSLIQHKHPQRGKVVLLDLSENTVRLTDCKKNILPAVNILTGWIVSKPEPPITILNKHCPYCEFQHVCRPIAEQEDSISLLGAGAKDLLRYEKKGIFTIKQLSFLYRPSKRKRRSKPHPALHKYELQALALRTGNIYLQDNPVAIPHADTEIFFDFESIPDNNFHYLIGVTVRTSEKIQSFQFWADCQKDEVSIWNNFVALIEQYPTCPLFHYGNFERIAIKKMGKQYNTPINSILDRLFNVNTCIFGKIYFPVKSNSLKDICRFIGLSWTSDNASGLQSIVWRYQYEDSGDLKYRQLLETYNHEDCENLRYLTQKLRDIAANGKHSPEIRFADIEGGALTESASSIVGDFNKLLHSAHGTYEQSKIVINKAAKINSPGTRNDNLPGRFINEKVNKIVNVRRGRTCPRHPGKVLKPRMKEAAHTIIDLEFTTRGVKKVVTKYVGKVGFCSTCLNEFSPPAIRRLGRSTKYGHGIKAWAAYHRMALHLSFDNITQLIGEMFGIRIRSNALGRLVHEFSQYYVYTEKILLKKILTSPVIHVDETTISITGTLQYVWVITDGIHVVFRHSEGREALIAHELFDGYSGVLCSDFYPGYDSVQCTQQKCWVHFIRDLNDDLRKSPFDVELEYFVTSVRDLIVPIFEAIDKYGLKVRNLRRFKKSVDQFYDRYILGKTYRSDLVATHQKRFAKYRDKLFVFLDRDGVPWNNNMAERAIRHLAVQRKISGSFGKDKISHYLLLLGITQTCRFKNKSLLQFFLSGERDIDKFKGRESFDGRHVH